MSYTKHTWVTGETITAEKLNNIEDGVDDLSRQLSDLETEISDIAPLKINGIKIVDGTNLMPSAEILIGRYYSANNGKLVENISNSYNCAKIPAKPGTYKSNSNMRFSIAVDEDENVVFYTNSNRTSFDAPATTKYIYVSVSTSLWDTFAIGFGDNTPTDTKYEWPNLLEIAGTQIENAIYGTGFATVTGTLADGEMLMVPRANVKKNNVYAFRCDIETLETIRIGHGQSTYDSSFIDISATKVTTHNYISTTDYPHEYIHVIMLPEIMNCCSMHRIMTD